MAQIITLKEMQDRSLLLKQSHIETDQAHGMALGPAKVLLFTGVRYERYDESRPEASKLAKRSRRKKSMPH